jgi:mannose-6-phosphate isomerase
MLLIDWVRDYALPRWWENGADHVRGGFFESLDATGTPVEGPRRARVIARQIFVYSAASREAGPGPWIAAAEHGLTFMLERFMRPDGLIRMHLSPDGAPLDDEVRLYDQAFCLFALASALRAGLTGDLTARAHRLVDMLERNWRGPHGGFVERGRQPYQSNPHMHLFEAALALEAAGAGSRFARLADEIGELALGRFIDADTGALREFFTADWSPAVGPTGRVVEPGHLFEWAWLLTSWSRLRDRSDAATAARRLHAVALAHGVDPVRGVAVDQLNADLSIANAKARLWPQTERIKAAAILAQDCVDPPTRAKLEDELARAADGLRLYLRPLQAGLWQDKLLEDGTFVDEPSPASSFYHIALALFDARARGYAL